MNKFLELIKNNSEYARVSFVYPGKLNFIYLNLAIRNDLAPESVFEEVNQPQQRQRPICSNPPSLGSICSKCGHQIKERELFTSKFVGCMC